EIACRKCCKEQSEKDFKKAEEDYFAEKKLHPKPCNKCDGKGYRADVVCKFAGRDGIQFYFREEVNIACPKCKKDEYKRDHDSMYNFLEKTHKVAMKYMSQREFDSRMSK